MKIDSLRIYSEVLEQGIDFKGYLHEVGFYKEIVNIYIKKGRGEFTEDDSLVDRIRKVKDVDILITCISGCMEIPLLMIEYSTAVPTDDHRMQRSDVYFWGAAFKIPMMKVSPSSKGMFQSFGGGSRLSDECEATIAYRAGGVFYPIAWKTEFGNDVLHTKESALSCIYHSDEIAEVLSMLIAQFVKAVNYSAYYEALREDYQERYPHVINSPEYSDDKLKNLIVDSTRFHWYDDKLCAKINRFGHAMDPDRGALYFVNMLVGFEKTITEIQVNRSGFEVRGGYNSLFDALTKKKVLIDYVQNIYDNKNNIFSDEDAIYVFLHALNLENSISFQKVTDGQYVVDKNIFRQFLFTHPSMTAKSIFYLSSELRLTDSDRKMICSIKWDKEVVMDYINSVSTNNYTPISIQPLTFGDAKEDIVTFASVELYRRMNCKLIAVSYPGAQGDRCILTGQGRTVLRTYVDIIAYKKNEGGAELFLEECKDVFSKSKSDVKKLKDIIKDEESFAGLALLARKTGHVDSISNVYLSVGAKTSKNLPRFDIDYIFMFDLTSDNNKTIINYSIAVINADLAKEFLVLSVDGRYLTGQIEMDQIYIIQ